LFLSEGFVAREDSQLYSMRRLTGSKRSMISGGGRNDASRTILDGQQFDRSHRTAANCKSIDARAD